ncbi:MAG: hypothetical protein PUP92_07440, partial [Rhizonema sp. PD38]|nr:hypothetical protein [Rhizonema sp. PD38]
MTFTAIFVICWGDPTGFGLLWGGVGALMINIPANKKLRISAKRQKQFPIQMRFVAAQSSSNLQFQDLRIDKLDKKCSSEKKK